MTSERICELCEDRPASVLKLLDIPIYQPCGPCLAKLEREREEETQSVERKERIEKFRKTFPPVYQDNDVNRFPPIWNRIADWKPDEDGAGVLLVGATGTCKSRMLVEICRDLTLDGVHCEFVTGAELARLTREQWAAAGSVTHDNARERLKTFRWCKVLVIDDLGKQNLTPAVEEALFDLIDHRTSHRRPCLISANADAQDLLEMCSEDVGPALVRRLREFNTAIVLKGDS